MGLTTLPNYLHIFIDKNYSLLLIHSNTGKKDVWLVDNTIFFPDEISLHQITKSIHNKVENYQRIDNTLNKHLVRR